MPKTLTPVVIPAPTTVALTPEVVDPRIADVESVARWLDYAFELPGGFRFGVAGIVGLIPGIGDILDAIVSLYIVTRAIQVGVARVAIARMLVNICIEGIAGSVPFVGDLFDVAFKANKRNYLILKSHLAEPRRQQAKDWLFLLAAFLLAIVAIVLPMFALFKLFQHL
jgi:hypothetical protein